MGIQQTKHIQGNDANQSNVERAKSCMAIIWVKDGSNELDKMRLLQTVKKMEGVFDASFTRETPAIMMIDYCTKEVKAGDLAKNINDLGIIAKIVGC